MTRVKICGNTNPEDARLAVSLGADYLGFIFAPSKRRVSRQQASEIMAATPDFKRFVGVFVNQPKKEVETLARDLGLRLLQFHGEETALYCRHFTELGFEVIKTFKVKDAMSLKRLDQYNVSAFLFDTFSKDQAGGTGVPFDWKLIEEKPFIRERFFLAGGLNAENLADAIRRLGPYAVDVASGVESVPGRKDPERLRRFIEIAKHTQTQHAETRPFLT